MGRRAKNKQGAPQPLEPFQQSTTKPGKRKPDTESPIGASRPNKKLKDVSNKGKGPTLPKLKNAASNGKGKPQGKGHKILKEGSQSESEDGWEDVEDGTDLKAQARFVPWSIEHTLFWTITQFLTHFRSLFRDSDDEFPSFRGDSSELEADDDGEEE